MARIREPRCRVHFKYPDGSIRTGWVIKATKPKIIKGELAEGGDYAVRVELIQFDDSKDKFIRFAYWRRPHGKKGDNDWNWASQTTWVFGVDVTREAIKEAEELGLFKP